MTKAIAMIAAGLVAALLGALALYVATARGTDDQFAHCREGAVAGGAGAVGGPFELVDQSGRTVRDTEVITRPSILYFGYTFCPDVCPIDVGRNAVAVDLLQERGYDVQPLFVTVDPARDTAEVLAGFAEAMHPDMIALGGNESQVKAAADAYRVYYQSHAQQGGDEFYLVDHTSFSYLVLPEHGFVEFFRRDASPEAMAQRAACFIDAA